MIDTVLYISTIVLLIILIPSKTMDFSASLNMLYSLIYFLIVSFFLIRHRRFSKNWVRFDVLFLIGFTIVHIQIPALASLGVEPYLPDFVWINKNVVNYATWLSVLSITMWMLGYSSYKIKKNKIEMGSVIVKINNYIFFDVFLLLSLISFLIAVGPAFFLGIYDGGESWGGGAVYSLLLLSTLLYLRIIYFFKDLPKPSGFQIVVKSFFYNKLFFIVYFLFLLLFLYTGDRGPILKVILFSIGAYALFIKPISFRKLLTFTIVGAFVFTIIGMGRGRNVDNFDGGTILERGYSAYSQVDDINITNELAMSNRILYMAIDTVPDRHPYLYGFSYVTSILGTIPFLGSLIVNAFDIPQMYRGSSDFFTVISLGSNSSWGVGSELLADIYINFGLFGVFIIMFVFGRFSAKAYMKSFSLNINYIIIYLFLLTDAIYLNRGILISAFKPIVYMLIVNYFFMRFKK